MAVAKKMGMVNKCNLTNFCNKKISDGICDFVEVAEGGGWKSPLRQIFLE